ncbi:NTP transferase domain-containing protein [Aquimarina sp. AU474]|uniref:nucleotidyltransferase family protein n=1 Tax=Aquimarina sp. AU474 TaxID=2108529 RepID=UPI000D694782|nr:nucleotidyltransferase family protein [Aquimarina sp. AU474]
MSKTKIAHLILAAGSSSRMGTPKQLLPWANTTLIENAIQQSLALENVDTFVVLGANFKLINDRIKNSSITILNNTNWQSGMGSSISCGINYIVHKDFCYDAVLISVIDQPLIEADHFSKLITGFKEKPDHIVASDLGNRIGVPALFSKNLFSELSKFNKDYGARYLIDKYQNRTKTIPAKDIAIDVDTVEQYEALYKRKFLS